MDDAERQIVNAMKEVMEKSKVEVAIKKSVSVKQLVTNDGDNEGEVENVSITKPVKMRTPYQPGPGPNPKPKHYGIFIPTKKK